MTKSDVLQSAVRPIVTLLLTATICYGFVVGKVSSEAFIGLVGSVVTFWFTQRVNQKDAPKDRAGDQPNGSGR